MKSFPRKWEAFFFYGHWDMKKEIKDLPMVNSPSTWPVLAALPSLFPMNSH